MFNYRSVSMSNTDIDSIPSKYTKLEENFGGFMNKSLVRFE